MKKLLFFLNLCKKLVFLPPDTVFLQCAPHICGADAIFYYLRHMYVAQEQYFTTCATYMWRRCNISLCAPHICGAGVVFHYLRHIYVAQMRYFTICATYMWRKSSILLCAPHLCGADSIFHYVRHIYVAQE